MQAQHASARVQDSRHVADALLRFSAYVNMAHSYMYGLVLQAAAMSQHLHTGFRTVHTIVAAAAGRSQLATAQYMCLTPVKPLPALGCLC